MTAAETEANPPGNKTMIWEIFSLLMLTASELVMGCEQLVMLQHPVHRLIFIRTTLGFQTATRFAKLVGIRQHLCCFMYQHVDTLDTRTCKNTSL